MDGQFPFKLRPYQSAIVDSIKQYGSTLVVLPTGLGKTVIAFSIIYEFLKEKQGRILFLAPTKPLVEQHYSSFKKHFPKISNLAILITGEVKKDKRKHLYDSATIIFATPQTISNDIESGIFNAKDVALVIFDEAHRAVGSYAYVLIAKALPDNCLRVGLTASPGGEKKRIKEVMENLGITNVELRTYKSSDVSPYIKPMEIKWVFVELSPIHKSIQKLLMNLSKSLLIDLSNMGVVVTIKSKKRLLESRARLLNLPPPYRFKVLLPYFTLVLTQHALELLETEGLYSLKAFLDEVGKKKSRSARVFLKKPEVKKILSLLEKTNISEEDHPKLKKLLSLVESLKDKKIIIFSQYRSQVERITNMLREEGFKAEIFLGKRKGFSQKKQKEIIEAFRRDEFNILVSSSIGEEGLDIPGVDAVIFYEPVPSEIRAIQRRGRAGRFDKGLVYILITKGTRDEAFFWSAMHKEKKMQRILSSIGKKTPIEKVEKDDSKKETKENKPQKQQLSISDFL